MTTIRGLIFDFDGLIVDTELPVFQAWQEVYRAHGSDLAFTEWARCIGTSDDHFDPYQDLAEQLGRPLDRTAIDAALEPRHLALVEAQPILPGVRETLRAARERGLKLGVASTSPRKWVAGHLARLELDHYFDALACGDEVARVKPAPDLYQAALERLGLAAPEAIALEDSPHGVRAAQAAGIFAVAIPNPLTSQLDLDHADLRITSLAETPLDALLDRVSAQRGRG